MQENKYEKRKRQKKRNAIIASISFTGVAILGIIAFLGRDIGSFTVKAKNDSVKLSLSKKYASEEKSSFLLVKTIPAFEQKSYVDIMSLGDDILDNEDTDDAETGYMLGKAANLDDNSSLTSLNFFKYTFYVSNEGNKTAAYDMDFKVVEDVKSTTGDNRSLLDTLHVVIYQNEVVNDNSIKTHNKEVYARAPVNATRHDENGNPVHKEYISVSPEKSTSANPYMGFAEPFVESNNEVTSLATYHVKSLKAGEYIRYTFLCYLDGDDDESDKGEGAPEGASIKLEIDVNGYESKNAE